MSVAILYHHPDRAGEAGVAVISELERVPAEVESLSQRGFVIDKISGRNSSYGYQST